MEWIHQPVEYNTTQSANLPIEHLQLTNLTKLDKIDE